MRVGLFAALCAAGLMYSCGLETVPSLVAPNVNYADGTLVTDSQLSMIHDAGRYEGSSFQGYVVYYKIYPISNTADFARLLADRSSLSSTPTVAQLGNLGYQSFTASNNNSGTSSGIEQLLVKADDEEKITLDFDAFLQSPDSTIAHPLLEVDGVAAPKPYLYRTGALVGTDSQSFYSLRTAVQRDIDMASTMTTQELSEHEFEINVFVAAYGVTNALVEVYSSPAPWGVIRPVEP